MNAQVIIYQDRIEWSRRSLRVPGGTTAAVMTAGLSLLATHSRKDTSTIPARMIQAVTTHRAGISYTPVKVATAREVTEFRVTKAQAEQVKSLLLQLMSGTASLFTPAPQAYPPVPVPAPPSSLPSLRTGGAASEGLLS